MDINLNVGSGAEIGESIIQDVNGVSVTINRSLRDLLHQTPSIEVSIKVRDNVLYPLCSIILLTHALFKFLLYQIHELRAALSNREYQILTECAQSNISEIPHTVPPLTGDIVASSRNLNETLTSEDPNTAQTETSDTWISMKVSVVINLVELCLYAGTSRDAPLAAVQVRFRAPLISFAYLFKSTQFCYVLRCHIEVIAQNIV